MSKILLPPKFIAFTGADSTEDLPAMTSLSRRYPIEWGILLDPAQVGKPRFPNSTTLQSILGSGLMLAAHVCGEPARAIAAGRDPMLDLRGFGRLQVNHGTKGSSDEVIENCYRFGEKNGVQVALQCQSDFPNEPRVDWLFDVSFGEGVKPTLWPALSFDHPLCGFSGGLSPETVVSALSKLQSSESKLQYWIDMESGVRTNGSFDLSKCQAVCERVFGRLPE